MIQSAMDFPWYAIQLTLGLSLLTCLVVFICKFHNNRAVAEKVCYYLSWIVLIYKGFHYYIYCAVLNHDWLQQIPAEISQLTYFICPIAYLSQNKYLRDGGAFLGIFAGFVQLVASMAAPYTFVKTGLNFVNFTESTIMHFTVLSIGLIQITCIFKMKWSRLWSTYGVLLFVILWGVLASFTWRYGTDAEYPDAPANIGFVQRCVLPEQLTTPWMLEGHNFILVYLAIFFVYTALVYSISYLAFKNNKQEQEKSLYGLGWREYRKFIKSKSLGSEVKK